ncbi:16S rRNA (cytosine(1402)-N(4))-methyltransferase [Candidatus Shapirobacteria bacterium CG09_land_8_20_14_0_10_47_13]|uniref:Ribosomal RNA small subunit methyltransferase H n=1 Tax=Candidatus Shapirobacteria bacterium CG09_land_8_20_14_0_10_47_13 TaxID=1974481 RepID=A0A2H0WMZ3_9BACT|nr:MAG: 16S rRNA (cytosine(1402)-N(4))-methyltransferase [Candidatus Shapirobacteria bacterium CG09_land_8_20_14_0_10_47_13]
MSDFHTPVLLQEVVDNLKIKRGGQYIDATVGGGGHAAAILKLGGKLLGIDCDPEAIKAARKSLASACPTTFWRLARGNFKNLEQIAVANGFSQVDGILLDLGVSSHQLETAERGFSFNLNGPLDMRMDPELAVTAADLVNGLNKGELTALFKKFSDEPRAGLIAEAIVKARRQAPIKTGAQLASVVGVRQGNRHPATRVFQALRMAVNDELNNLNQVLPQAVSLLRPGGRLAVISFHSGEDRLVKNFLKDQKIAGNLMMINKKPLMATPAETAANPRSRSAKLRVGEKL